MLGNVSAKRDEKVTLYKSDGVRFMHFPKVTVLDAEAEGGFFLAFRFTSMPHPDVTEHYLARIGAHGAVVERDGPDNPPPAYRFGQIFQRPGSDVFRIELKSGDVFRLRRFEMFDPKTYGQADAWSVEVVESAGTNWPDYRMRPGTNYGPFLESDVTEIFDERSGEIVFARKE